MLLTCTCTVGRGRRALCCGCLSDSTVELSYVKKNLNIFGDQAERLLQLPTTYNYSSSQGVCRKALVLKEDVAALYETSWEIFKRDTASRLEKWCEILRHTNAHALAGSVSKGDDMTLHPRVVIPQQ